MKIQVLETATKQDEIVRKQGQMARKLDQMKVKQNKIKVAIFKFLGERKIVMIFQICWSLYLLLHAEDALLLHIFDTNTF